MVTIGNSPEFRSELTNETRERLDRSIKFRIKASSGRWDLFVDRPALDAEFRFFSGGKPVKWISTARLVMALGLACMASQAMAQQGATAQSFDELSARLEQQDQQIQQLQAQVSGMQQGSQRDPGGLCTWAAARRQPPRRRRRSAPRSAAT